MLPSLRSLARFAGHWNEQRFILEPDWKSKFLLGAKTMKALLWVGSLAGLIVIAVSFSATADLSDRYAIDVHKPDKAYGGTTIFGDNSDRKNPVLVEVDMNGRVVWSYDIQTDRRDRGRGDGGMDVEWIPGSDHILFTQRSGVYEVDRKKKIVWSYKAPASHDADRLPNGNTLMAWGWGDDSSDPEVREVDPQGKVVWQWQAAKHLKGEKRILDLEGFTHTNSVIRLANGNTLVSLRNFYMLVEVAPSGQIVWKLPDLITTPHDPEILPNGNILVNTREPQVISEITPGGTVIWQYRPNQQDVNVVRYNHRLPNGNIIFAERTKIVEVTPAKEIVWQLRLKHVGADNANKPNWLYKAERIPADRRAVATHAFAAPSETLAKSGEAVLSSEQRIREQARRTALDMMARMDADGDGRIARPEFAGQGVFENIDTDNNNFISVEEAETFSIGTLLRQAGGERRGGGRR